MLRQWRKKEAFNPWKSAVVNRWVQEFRWLGPEDRRTGALLWMSISKPDPADFLYLLCLGWRERGKTGTEVVETTDTAFWPPSVQAFKEGKLVPWEDVLSQVSINSCFLISSLRLLFLLTAALHWSHQFSQHLSGRTGWACYWKEKDVKHGRWLALCSNSVKTENHSLDYGYHLPCDIHIK